MLTTIVSSPSYIFSFVDKSSSEVFVGETNLIPDDIRKEADSRLPLFIREDFIVTQYEELKIVEMRKQNEELRSMNILLNEISRHLSEINRRQEIEKIQKEMNK